MNFDSVLFPCSQISSIIKPGKAFNIRKKEKLAELSQRVNLTLEEEDKLFALLEEQELCDILGKGAKSFLIRRYVIEKYYREHGDMPLQMLKGTTVEVNALEFYCDVINGKHKKNKKRYENLFLQGTPDVVEKNLVLELKTSWDLFTFLKNVHNDVNNQYYWQLQGYLAITDKEFAELVYCLVSTPDEIIEEEYNRIIFRKPQIATDKKLNKQLRDKLYFNMRFDDIPKEERILRFSVERNDQDIARIHRKVKQCREYLQEFQTQHLYFTKQHRKSILSAINTEVEDGNSEA